MLNLKKTQKQFERQNEDSSFFNLLKLHNNIVQGITFNDSSSYIAFTSLVEHFNKIYDGESWQTAKYEINNNTEKLSDKAFEFVWQKISTANKLNENYNGSNDQKRKIISFFSETANNYDNLVTPRITSNCYQLPNYEDEKKLIKIGYSIIKKLNSECRIAIIQKIYDKFFHRNGHILGHYFQNINYILQFINDSKRQIEYSRIFRAQLSRYELTAVYYYLLSSNSSINFIQLIHKFDILNAIYCKDICYSPDKKTINNDIQTAEILKMNNEH